MAKSTATEHQMSLPCMTEFISPQWESSHAAMTFWWDVPDSELIVTVVLLTLARPNTGSAGRYGSADGKLRCFFPESVTVLSCHHAPRSCL